VTMLMCWGGGAVTKGRVVVSAHRRHLAPRSRVRALGGWGIGSRGRVGALFRDGAELLVELLAARMVDANVGIVIVPLALITGMVFITHRATGSDRATGRVRVKPESRASSRPARSKHSHRLSTTVSSRRAASRGATAALGTTRGVGLDVGQNLEVGHGRVRGLAEFLG